MDYIIAIAMFGVCIWILFMDGAENIESSWMSWLMFMPGMTATEIRFGAIIVLILLLIWFLFFSLTA